MGRSPDLLSVFEKLYSSGSQIVLCSASEHRDEPAGVSLDVPSSISLLAIPSAAILAGLRSHILMRFHAILAGDAATTACHGGRVLLPWYV